MRKLAQAVEMLLQRGCFGKRSLGADFEMVLFNLRYEESERVNHVGYLGKSISGRD